MWRLTLSALGVASLLVLAASLQAQTPLHGGDIRFRTTQAAIPDGFRMAWTEASWAGASQDSMTFRLSSGRYLKLPISGLEIQRQAGNQAKLFSLVGGLIGAGAGALVALSKYDEQWTQGREAGCSSDMSLGGGGRCWEARAPTVYNQKGDESLGGALVGGLVGGLIGWFIGARTPAWVTVDPLEASVHLSLQLQ